MSGKVLPPPRATPLVIASAICWSVQPPRPVSLSAVRLVLYTVPKGMGNGLPPACGVPFGSLWQAQPAAREKIYWPFATSSLLSVCACAAPANNNATNATTQFSGFQIVTPYENF